MGEIILFAQQISLPTEYEIKIKNSKMPPVKFSHIKHSTEYQIDCKICHHKSKVPAKGVQKCIKCHDLKEEKEGVPKAMSAYHKNCLNCHKKINIEQEKSAPIRCNECHKRFLK
ncbi:MAG: cytochrome C3 subunit A [Thermodesulfobacteriota bacterium]|nr:MAG: cytochrome C3 subunit A [Thermodesulfobacteriota bacterium]